MPEDGFPEIVHKLYKGITMSCKLTIILIVFSFLFSGISCKKNSQDTDNNELSNSYPAPVQTNDGWETARPSHAGLDEHMLTDLADRINDNTYNEIHSILIIKDGMLVFEEYSRGHDFNFRGQNFHGALINFDMDTPHNTHSATKSVVSALTGILIDKGIIQDTNVRISNYFNQYSDLFDSLKNTITIEHLLTMTSGLQWNEWDVHPSDPAYDTYLFNISADPIRYVLSKPVVTRPGSSFYYNGGAVDLLGELLHQASDTELDSLSKQYLFGPLGITNFEWQRLWSGLIVAHGDIYIRPRDMAKFGFLFLNDGVWNGTQIISADWVNRSIQQYLPLPQVYWADGYGYLWWKRNYYINDEVIVSTKAMGWGGQEIILLKELDMMVVFTGACYVIDPPCDDIMDRFILPSVVSLQ